VLPTVKSPGRSVGLVSNGEVGESQLQFRANKVLGNSPIPAGFPCFGQEVGNDLPHSFRRTDLAGAWTEFEQAEPA